MKSLRKRKRLSAVQLFTPVTQEAFASPVILFKGAVSWELISRFLAKIH